ncbi:hypothetical protein [Pontibacter russatus]|uniref:hypothetical protein n=1 Tax=Pontibacter russatus TaxID=2694929 RepID=UPI00137A88C0|nr:hypothetical protein [Pontibacter russatus]
MSISHKISRTFCIAYINLLFAYVFAYRQEDKDRNEKDIETQWPEQRRNGREATPAGANIGHIAINNNGSL